MQVRGDLKLGLDLGHLTREGLEILLGEDSDLVPQCFASLSSHPGVKLLSYAQSLGLRARKQVSHILPVVFFGAVLKAGHPTETGFHSDNLLSIYFSCLESKIRTFT